MIPKDAVALALADTMLARDATLAGLIASATWAFGHPWPWIPDLCEQIHARTAEHFYHFSRHELAQIIFELDVFHDAWDGDGLAPELKRYCLDLPLVPPPPEWLAVLALPALPSVGDLARWLRLRVDDIAWFADQWRLDAAPAAQLEHYHYRWVPKRSGGVRLIEIPKQRLRAMQATILRELLDRVPAHPAAHGFRRGYSCVTHAALHTGQRAVIRMDLKDFFPSIPASRIHALFAKLGYSQSVAGVLARLCVNRVPAGVLRAPTGDHALTWMQRQALRTPHLPQGSPCSPALANACAWRLDVRLDTLAQSLGARYSRYADDLVFSGGRELERAMDRFHAQVGAIAIEEGFALNARKTRMMRAGVRQQVTGIVVNRHPNIARDEFDLLKATLTNCARHGPQTQNRDHHPDLRAYLAGKVAYVTMVNPQRGQRLQRLFETIAWLSAPGQPDNNSGQQYNFP
ncbi:reverse transcriptase family protein [Massilia sp. P8910]|uniref:reverse transcriptase family protein n=1 Tax=Massilia antarctica TaxID=2765360 RepID=UPI001E5BBDCB|nr:reverse transcriptase family protein [Massilia antarctica]MCE3607622.1 reverse transcriptase family protein [Massilia antarctica]